jgi:hypothetical protein
MSLSLEIQFRGLNLSRYPHQNLGVHHDSGRLVVLEILRRAFVFLGGRASLEGTQIATSLGARIYLARVQSILAR